MEDIVQSDQARISQLKQEVQQLSESIADRRTSGLTAGYAGLYATLSEKYMELYRLKYDEYYSFESSRENLNKAVEMAGDSDLQYLAKRAEIYVDAQFLVAADKDLATLRNALSKRPSQLSASDRAYFKSICEKLASKLERFRKIEDARNEIDQMRRGMTERQLRGKDDGGLPFKELSDLYMELFELNNDQDAFDSAIENINVAVGRVEWEGDRSKYYEYVARRAELCIDARAYDEAERDITTLRNEMSKMPSVLEKHAIDAKALRDELQPLEGQYDDLKRQIRSLRDLLDDNKWAVVAAKKASAALPTYIDSLGEKLAVKLESSESASTRSPQGGGRTRRALRSQPRVQSGRRMSPMKSRASNAT